MTSRYRQFIDYDTGGSERLYSHADICPGKPDCVHEEEESMEEAKPTPTREDELNARVREVPLLERLDRSNSMIAKMCSERRPPKMTIPVQWYDEDYFICLTVKDSKALIAALREALETAIKTIRACNGLGVPKSQEPALWELYQASPEMKKINAALALAKAHKGE